MNTINIILDIAMRDHPITDPSRGSARQGASIYYIVSPKNIMVNVLRR